MEMCKITSNIIKFRIIIGFAPWIGARRGFYAFSFKNCFIQKDK